MPGDFISLNPREMPVSEVYDLLVAGVQPRPIAFISTVSLAGRRNLAPFSFFMPGGANPPSVVYSSTLNASGAKKYSLINAEETGEFVASMVTRSMADAMNAFTPENAERGSEWDNCGFNPLPSEFVRPERIAQSPIQFECKVFEIVQHGDTPLAACYVIGEVVRIHVLDSVWNGSAVDISKFRPISRMGGPHYLDTNSMELFSFEAPRPDSDSS
jgi:flavin reductase (DIM6/NTAB) family NADH-FMN oxidoreductase RutF